MNKGLERNSSVVDGIIQEQAHQIADLAKCLDKRMKLKAPIDMQIETCEAHNAVRAMLCELFNDHEPTERKVSHRLVSDTLEEKITLLRMLEEAREEIE